jgi:2-oxoglutarate dehydrogenase E1 component
LLQEDSEDEYVPLQHLSENQAEFRIYNSLLSEYAALGFEYGYACATPNGLTIWEAQFGDFANGAQVIIDQFIYSSEAKWKRLNGIVLYLPHGYEGQGPDHSSAKMERFLQLCANNNMNLVNCTTPANFFHVLRRHIKMPFRTPLIIFTPKSLLRHPLCVSPLEEFTGSVFREVLDDSTADPKLIKKVLLCSGKIYYDLLERWQKEKRSDIAIVRLEQLYPLPMKRLKSIIKKYGKAEEFVWVQEEPRNMGAWPYLCCKFDLVPLKVISRNESPTPATGFYKQHVIEQQAILEEAFKGN